MRLFLGVLGILLLAVASVLVFPKSESEAPLLSVVFPEASEEATLLFVGDMMFDRYIRASLANYGNDHVLGGVAELLSEPDLTLGNLEGPITGNASVSVGSAVGSPSNMRFTFGAEIPALMAEYGIDIVSVANNHILDFGEDGVQETLMRLRNVGIWSIGNPSDTTPVARVREVSGIRIGLIPYNDFYGPRAPETYQAIRDTQESVDVVIVMAHWGEEYLPEPPERVRKLGRAFIDAGADVVIGTHPHVIQSHEDYSGGRIYYSLGNFVFDQYWNEEVRCGEAVHVTIQKKGEGVTLSYKETLVGMEQDGSTVLGCR